MSLTLTEEQEILQRTAREFVGGRAPLKRLRELRDDPLGYSPALWREMAQLGWAGIVLPEEHGGAGLGFVELMVVMEEFGRGLVPEPMLSNVLLGAAAVWLGGSAAQRAAELPGVAAGDRVLALAWQEPTSRYDACQVATRATPNGSGWTLQGEKRHVLDGHAADAFVVSARTAGGERDRDGVTCFLIAKDTPGVTVERQWRVDGRAAAIVTLDGVRVDSGAVVGAVGQGGALLARVIDRATVALCAEMLGGMMAAFEMTLDYLKTRKQFGVPIGSFQALKHRAARMFIETELCRSVVLAASQAVDGGDEKQIARLAGIAKVKCSEAYLLVANEGVQMHGGIGMTDEHDIGFYLKRARAAELTFGDAAWHRDRVARLDGY